jgi:hypothetical protein
VLVFINYRTGDGEVAAALIGGELSRRFGRDRVFRASTGILPGDDFERVILQAVRRSAVLLTIVGRHWLTAVDAAGRRRIDDPADWTRREILTAFDVGAMVLPVLLGSTPRLSPVDLPEPLRPLAGRQYLRLDHRNDEADLARIGDHVARWLPASATAPTAPTAPAAPAAAAGAALPPTQNTNIARGHARVGQQNGIVLGSQPVDERPAGERR